MDSFNYFCLYLLLYTAIINMYIQRERERERERAHEAKDFFRAAMIVIVDDVSAVSETPKRNFFMYIFLKTHIRI